MKDTIKTKMSFLSRCGKQERHIVATVGKFSVIWNFQQVKDGSHECYRNQQGLKSCFCYKIVLRDDSIVESRFMHDKFAVTDSPEAPLVIATPMKVSSFSISSKRWYTASCSFSFINIISYVSFEDFLVVCRIFEGVADINIISDIN